MDVEGAGPAVVSAGPEAVHHPASLVRTFSLVNNTRMHEKRGRPGDIRWTQGSGAQPQMNNWRTKLCRSSVSLG